jgi:hypothetical protein
MRKSRLLAARRGEPGAHLGREVEHPAHLIFRLATLFFGRHEGKQAPLGGQFEIGENAGIRKAILRPRAGRNAPGMRRPSPRNSQS